MELDKMPDQEKSVMLAKAMGWEYNDHWKVLTVDNSDFWYREFNLYAPENMALAWRVHGWAMDNEVQKIALPYRGWWIQERPWLWLIDGAQREYLDQILALCIEAGIIEEVE